MQAAKHGDPKKLYGAAKEIQQSMKPSDLNDFTRKKPKGIPEKVPEGQITARMMFHRERISEGRDDAPKLGLGKTELKFARMNSKQAFKTDHTGTDAKWKTSMQARAHLAGEKASSPMKSRDAVGHVPHAFESRAKALVAKMLNE